MKKRWINFPLIYACLLTGIFIELVSLLLLPASIFVSLKCKGLSRIIELVSLVMLGDYYA